MELPASYYGKLDKRNPVISTFERDINSFVALMRRLTSTGGHDNMTYSKGIKVLAEIWRNYKHRLPLKMYLMRMIQIADFLFGIKMYQLALWQGYGLHLLQFSPVNITDVTDVEHFTACFFPEGFDTDQAIVGLKIRAMLGCAMCIFELEKRQRVLSQRGLSKLLRVLNFIRIMMQSLQQHEHLCWQIYNGTLHIYLICRYLMTMNHSAQALEFLLWASVSLELSVPLMTAKYVPWIVTLYCAVCHCYYDNQASTKAEEFARRALAKISDLAKLEEQSGVAATRETRTAYKEASIKLGAMMFKRAVFEARRKPQPIFRVKSKNTLKDIPHGLWPSTATERMLMALFESRAAQFFAILETLWDSNTRPLQTKLPEEAELQDLILELLSAGMSILSGASNSREHKREDQPCVSVRALTATSTLMDLAVSGENKVPITSAVRFIKMLFHYKQPDAFTELAREMLQVLSAVEGQPFRKAELELTLLDSFNSLKSSQRNRTRDDITCDKSKFSLLKNDKFIGLVDSLHKSVCGSASNVQPDGDLVLDIVLFLWGKLKAMMQSDQLENLKFTCPRDKLVWCLSVLCEVAFACDLASVDCIMTVDMIHSLAILLESAAERGSERTRSQATHESEGDGMKHSSFSLREMTCTELLQEVYRVVERGLEALAKGMATLVPQDGSSVTDTAFMQKLDPSASSASSLISGEENGENDMDETAKEEAGTRAESAARSSKLSEAARSSLLAADLLLELNIILHRVSLKLVKLNAVAEANLAAQIKKNKVSKAHFLIQKALLLHNDMEPDKSSKIRSLLEEASTLIDRAGVEERKLYLATIFKPPAKNKGQALTGDAAPPAPILLSRTHQSFTFAPAPYQMEAQVCWYQLCGRVAEGVNLKVRLGDCSLPGTGNLVPTATGECVLRVDGLEPNQKYVFALAAYDSQGRLLGNAIGETTLPVLASMPVPLLSSWAHLAQVAFQTEQHAIAKRACSELWSHYTISDTGSQSPRDGLANPGLHMRTVRCSSPLLCQLFFTSIFIETEIKIQQGSLRCDSVSAKGLFIWEQEARLAKCEQMLVAMDLAMWLKDSQAALQAVIGCYRVLAPLIFHQIPCGPVVQVLKKCLIALEENSALLKEKWMGNASESVMHMIACITYYLSKALRTLKEHQTAAEMMDRGRTLLQEVYVAQQLNSRLASKALSAKAADPAGMSSEMKICPQLKALHAKKKKIIKSVAALSTNKTSHPLKGSEELLMLYERISSSPLQHAFQEVMKLRSQANFTEFAAMLLQRAIEEDQPVLLIKLGQAIFEILCRRDHDRSLSMRCLEGKKKSKKKGKGQTVKGNESSKKNKSTLSRGDARKKKKPNISRSVLQRATTNRERKALKKLLRMMAFLVQRRKKQLHLRRVYCQERAWRSHLNYSVAQAHLSLFYQGLDQRRRGAVQHRYSQFSPLTFSLAHSGVLVQWRNSTPRYEANSKWGSCLSGRQGDAFSARRDRDKKKVDDSFAVESSDDDEDPYRPYTLQAERRRRASALLLDSLNNAAVHLQRAMVLAHRGGHWTALQRVCQTVWDHNCRIAVLAQSVAQLKPPFLVTADQLHSTFTPLLVVAADLLMDMLNRLGLWSVYKEVDEEELECSLHFSVLLDDCTQVDLRWVCTLVLHTLEWLHDRGKWESLAHVALLFNSYTHERYALIVTPLLILAQRRLLERVKSFEEQTVPQAHYVKTQRVTGREVTCRSYADCQLLCGWSPDPDLKLLNHRLNLASLDVTELQDEQMECAQSLVCVPLDVEDTLSCYRQAFERRPYCLQILQHSRSLLLLLLAYTQPSELKHHQRRSPRYSTSLVDFSSVVMNIPNMQPCDLTEESYSTPNALYSLPISPDHMAIVAAAYSTSIKYLQANSHESLRVLALHEMGNLQLYNGNTRAARTCWSKAVDSVLQSSGVLEKWDGVSYGGGTLQQTLRQAGIWGCLQAAVLTAKTAQYVLTSEISQRTKCCLLSAYLFKCVLCSSLAQPQVDLQYASHSLGDELLPGVDLFSEPHRAAFSSAVASLNFICQWLFITGHHIKLLPMLALHQHFVGTVCRDVQRSVEGRILKIRTLAELCLFTEAVKEAVELTQGRGLLLPNGHYIFHDNVKPAKTFHSNKPLLHNAEALEELANCDFAPEVRRLYGPVLCLRIKLARAQLVLALSSTVHRPPRPEDHKDDRLDAEDSRQRGEQPKVLVLDSQKEELTPERIKFLLLDGAACLLQSMSFTSQSCRGIEYQELEIECNLLKANLHLQQGRAALSCEMAVSSLELLQSSPVILRRPVPGPDGPESELPPDRPGSGKGSTKDCGLSNPMLEDCPRAVEANERIGGALWLRCRVALIRSLTAQIPDTAAHLTGKNWTEEAALEIQQGLHECAELGDLDTQALLMVESAGLKARRGRTEESMTQLQEAVRLLSGRTCMPPASTLTLARATLLLSELRRTKNGTLLKLTQELLQEQLCVFGESVVLCEEKMCFSPEPSNIYLPHLHLLHQAMLKTGDSRDLSDAEAPLPAQASQPTSSQCSHPCSPQTEGAPQAGPLLRPSTQSRKPSTQKARLAS